MGIENEETAAGLLAGVGEYGRLKDMYGLTDDEVAMLESAYAPEETPDDDDKPNYDNGRLKESQVQKLQKILGVDADGKWGEKSKAASGGMTAEEAWDAYLKGELKPKKQETEEYTYSDAAKTFLSNLPYAHAGSSAEQWKRTVENALIAQYEKGILTEEDVAAIIEKLGL
jgi:hypothetical protein